MIIIILYSFYFFKWKKETSRESEKWARTRSYEYWKRKLKTRVYDCCDKDGESSLLFLLINFFVFFSLFCLVIVFFILLYFFMCMYIIDMSIFSFASGSHRDNLSRVRIE